MVVELQSSGSMARELGVPHSIKVKGIEYYISEASQNNKIADKWVEFHQSYEAKFRPQKEYKKGAIVRKHGKWYIVYTRI